MSSKSQPAKQKPHPKPDDTGRDQYKRHVDGDITVRGQIETHFPPEYAHRHDAERKQDAAIHNKSFWVGLFTLIAVTIYAGLTAWQGWLTRLAIKNTQENFIQENAPVIWVAPQTPTFKVDDLLRWDVHYTNYGHLTALNVHTCLTAAYGPKGFKIWEEFKFPPANCDRPIRSSGVSPPNHTDFTTIVGDKPLTAPQVSTINVTDGGAVAFGIITYDDIAGHSYETGFCSYRLISGALMHCEKYNYVRRIK